MHTTPEDHEWGTVTAPPDRRLNGRRFELAEPIPIRWDVRTQRRWFRTMDVSASGYIHNLSQQGARVHVDTAVSHDVGDQVTFTRLDQPGVVTVRYIEFYLGQTSIGVTFSSIDRAFPDLDDILNGLHLLPAEGAHRHRPPLYSLTPPHPAPSRADRRPVFEPYDPPTTPVQLEDLPYAPGRNPSERTLAP